MKYYASYPAQVAGRDVLLARTGYTGEDGFEIFAAPADAEHLWAELSQAGAADGLVPAGLAARDTLRLEAGMPLYGNELGADLTPFDAGLGRVVKLDKPGDFVGRRALAERAQAAPAAPAGRPDQPVAPRAAARLCRPVGRPAVRHGHQRRTVTDARRPDCDGLRPAGRGRCRQHPGRERGGWQSMSVVAPSRPHWWNCRSTAARPEARPRQLT